MGIIVELAAFCTDDGPLLGLPVLRPWETMVELDEYLGDAAAIFRMHQYEILYQHDVASIIHFHEKTDNFTETNLIMAQSTKECSRGRRSIREAKNQRVGFCKNLQGAAVPSPRSER